MEIRFYRLSIYQKETLCNLKRSKHAVEKKIGTSGLGLWAFYLIKDKMTFFNILT